MKGIKYTVNTKYVDDEVWFNANDILYMLKDSFDNFGNELDIKVLEQTLKASTVTSYQEYLKKLRGY